MNTFRTGKKGQMVGISVLIAVIALMVPMAIALAGSDETEITFSGEQRPPPETQVGNTLDFEVTSGGPGFWGLTGSGVFFRASTGIAESFTIIDSTMVGSSIFLFEAPRKLKINIQLDAIGTPHGIRVTIRPADFELNGLFGFNSSRGAEFDLRMELKAQ